MIVHMKYKEVFFLPIKQAVKLVVLVFPGFCKAPTRHYNHSWNSGDPTPGRQRMTDKQLEPLLISAIQSSILKLQYFF